MRLKIGFLAAGMALLAMVMAPSASAGSAVDCSDVLEIVVSESASTALLVPKVATEAAALKLESCLAAAGCTTKFAGAQTGTTLTYGFAEAGATISYPFDILSKGVFAATDTYQVRTTSATLAFTWGTAGNALVLVFCVV